MKQQKPYNPPAFINKFIDEGKITAQNFELVMSHNYLSVQPELTPSQKKELKAIEDKIIYLTANKKTS